MTLDDTALANLKVLNEITQPEDESLTHILIASGNVLSLMEKDSYDMICKLKSLEYPIYFTYHHIFNILTYDTSISYYQRKYLLEQIENSVVNLMNYISDYEEEDPLLLQIISDIEEKYDLVREMTIYKRCDNIVHLFDDLVAACRYASTCLYFGPYDLSLYSDDESDDDDTKDDADDEDADDEDTNDEDTDNTSGDEAFADGNFDEFVFEGISYLEDNRFQKIYTKDHKHIGDMNDNHDDILWLNDECMMDHESAKVKLD